MPLRVFGYGSLIFRPDLPFTARRPARLVGWARRFWQGSPDHRGTPEAPGRVVTLVPDPTSVTTGMLYDIPPARRDEVLDRLDHREQGGYERWRAEVTLPADAGRPVDALVYRATEDNPHFLGPAPLHEMAAHIARSHGPSGRNADYLLLLDEALAALDVHDGHVRALADAVRALTR